MTKILVDQIASRRCEEDRRLTMAERASALDRINSVCGLLPPRRGPVEQYHHNLAAARDEMIRWADRLHVAYPQYKDYWNGWLLCRAKRKITTKGGTCAEKGDLLLINPRCEVRLAFTGPFVSVQVWSMRSAGNFGISAEDVELL